MDADNIQPLLANIFEFMRTVTADDNDVAGANFNVLTIGRYARPTAAYDPGFGIGVRVHIRPGSRLIVDQKEGNT
jgi:hypothetical protein